MANEYRVGSVSVESLESGSGQARVSSVSVEVVETPPPSNARVSSVSLAILHSGIAATPAKVSSFAIEVLRSIDDAPSGRRRQLIMG